MEADWVAKRSLLRHLITLHPTWTTSDLATCLGHSESWVKKWRKRFREADPDDRDVLLSHSRARKTPPASTSPEVIQRILELRDTPPENLQRVPGPKALLYYLPRHAEGLPQGAHLPRSTRTSLQDSAPQRSDPARASSQAAAFGAPRSAARNPNRFQR
jgi:hypothetical protein